MTLWILLIFYSGLLVEVSSSGAPCGGGDLAACGADRPASSSSPRSAGRRPTWGDVAGSPKRRSARRRTLRKKTHRHSTRVDTLKPALVLLPPLARRPAPFLISVAEVTTSLPVPPEPRRYLLPPVPDQRDSYLEQQAPSTDFPTVQTSPAQDAYRSPSPQTYHSAPTTAETYPSPIPQTSYRAPTTVEASYRSPTTAETSYRSPTPEETSYRSSTPGETSYRSSTPEEFSYRSPAAPVQTSYRSTTSGQTFSSPDPGQTSHRSIAPAEAFFSSPTPTSHLPILSTPTTDHPSPLPDPFIKLEKEYNDIQQLIEYQYARVPSSNLTYDEVTQRQTTEGAFYSPIPAYNATPTEYTERWNGSFFEERSLRNVYSKSNDVFNVVNNSLLAPEVASLGMKIVTSKKAVEMVKEFASLNNTTSYPSDPVYLSGNLNLETAETGDIRLQAYDNQILTIDLLFHEEDTNEVSKEALKAIKKTRKPFQICNGRQGYVPDSNSGCQVFYICLGRGAGEPMMCPNGTLFNQDFLVCDWWYNVECNG